MPLKLTMACNRYDRSLPLIDGTVRPAGIELDVRVMTDDYERQATSRTGAFDATEFFTGTYIADLPYRSLGFTAIPIFVKRMFRHSYIYINTQSGIQSPADLNGKRVGVQQWFNSTAIWVRGMLAEDHGVDLASIQWVAQRGVRVGTWAPPDWLKLEVAPVDVGQRELLESGAIDACITTYPWAPGGHPHVDFLFPNYAQLEREYFARTRYFPIMHTLVIKTAVLDEHPWVAMSLFDAWQESKQRCYEWLEWQRMHQTGLWYRALWEEEQAVAGSDPYAWGFSAGRAELEKMLTYAYEQGVAPRKYAPESLFHPSTLGT